MDLGSCGKKIKKKIAVGLGEGIVVGTSEGRRRSDVGVAAGLQER